MTRRHSTVFDALKACRQAVAEAGLPAHPTTLDTPFVSYGDNPPTNPDELVQVRMRIDEDAEIAWARFTGVEARGRTETFQIAVIIRSLVSGVSEDECVSRLDQLAEVVEAAFYDADGNFVLPDADWLFFGQVGQVVPEFAWSEEGAVGACTIGLNITAHVS